MNIDPADLAYGGTIPSAPRLDGLMPEAGNPVAGNRGQEKPW
jgi:hypothetical protein